MKPRWLNDKQPDENGDITAVVENADGTPVSVFKGKTIEEVADKLLEGQTQANREIARLFKKIRPDHGRKTLKPQTKVLTADDKFRLASEMSDPDKERIGKIYGGKDWRALAKGGSGRWYAVNAAESEMAAADRVLQDCRQTETQCQLRAIGNFRIDRR